MNSNEESKASYRRQIAGLSKQEAIERLEYILFLIQQDNYMNWSDYYACKELLEEVMQDE